MLKTITQTIIPKPYKLTPLQEFCNNCHLSNESKLFILEDIPGSGKTESAFILAHRILQNTQGSGIFMALPTMATADGIYDRVKNFISKSLIAKNK